MAEFDEPTNPLQRKLGPLTGLQWALIAAGLIVVFVVVKRMQSSKAAAAAAPTGQGTDGLIATDPTISDTSQYGITPGPIGNYLASDPTNPAYPVGLTPQGIAGPVTNQQWARLVSDQLIGRGDDPTLVNNALVKFLSGQTLDAQDQAIVNQGISSYGQLPEGLLPIQIVTGSNGGSGTGSTSGSGTPSTAVYRSTGGKYQTLQQFATGAGITVNQLIALNPLLQGRTSIPPYQTLKVHA